MLGVIAGAVVIALVIMLVKALMPARSSRPGKNERLVRDAERALYWSNRRRRGK